MTARIRANQGDLAEIMGVDRTSIHAWQRSGMPHISQGAGKAVIYIVPLCMRWRLGQKVAPHPRWKVDARNTVDRVAFGAALSELSEEGAHYTTDQIMDDLLACGVAGAERFPVRYGYFQAIAAHRTGDA